VNRYDAVRLTAHELFLSVNFRTYEGAEEVLQRVPSGKVSVTANPRQRGDGARRWSPLVSI